MASESPVLAPTCTPQMIGCFWEILWFPSSCSVTTVWRKLSCGAPLLGPVFITCLVQPRLLWETPVLCNAEQLFALRKNDQSTQHWGLSTSYPPPYKSLGNPVQFLRAGDWKRENTIRPYSFCKQGQGIPEPRCFNLSVLWHKWNTTVRYSSNPWYKIDTKICSPESHLHICSHCFINEWCLQWRDSVETLQSSARYRKRQKCCITWQI